MKPSCFLFIFYPFLNYKRGTFATEQREKMAMLIPISHQAKRNANKQASMDFSPLPLTRGIFL